jgi:hypothetical protein
MDVFFISYQEPNAEINWSQVLYYHPRAKRIHGIQGIDKIHLLCDQTSTTEFFWTIDGDNWLDRELVYTEDIDTDLIMFKAIDPLHKGLTLLGGAKLWRKGSITNRDMSKGDFSLNATENKTVIDYAFTTTNYNRSPYDTWKTAFRHCVKLMSMIFRSRPNAKNLDTYLEQWKSCKDSSSYNADWAYKGFLDAEQYVQQFDNNFDELNKINDYQWLAEYFKECHGTPNKN